MKTILDHKLNTIFILGKNIEPVDKQFTIANEIPHVQVKKLVYPLIADALDKLSANADIVIVNLSEQAMQELKSLNHPKTSGKSIIVVGDKNNVNLLSLAISFGVTEFVNTDNFDTELRQVIDKIIFTRSTANQATKNRKLNAVINAKGGSGASIVASNIAYVLSEFKDSKVALLDMDLQFGTLGLNFDVAPKYTIVEALETINEIDYVSIDAYMTNYSDRLKLLLPSSNDVILPGEIQPAEVKALLNILQLNYNQIIIDLPRIIDPLSTTILEQSDHITIVLQQTLAQFRDGRRMVQILNKDLEIPFEKIIIALNRYDPKNSLKKSDLIEMVNHENVFTIANDFERVASASNLGEPFCKASSNSKIAGDIRKLAEFLGDEQQPKNSSGFVGRLKGLFS